MILTVFTACSGGETDSTEESQTHETISEIPTEEAMIKESDAVKYIEESYTPEELGLDNTDRDYSFMVASSGVEIEEENYIKVVANVITKNDATTQDGKDTFSLETIGEYYISYDGEKVLKKDMESGEYSELENRYDAYKEKGETTKTTTQE